MARASGSLAALPQHVEVYKKLHRGEEIALFLLSEILYRNFF